jgi:2-hydroxychromene-2-carboxylate isomerase
MQRTVAFYFGIGSRYSYLASTQIERLEADTGCRVLWRPVYGTDLMAARGMDPFRGTAPSGQYEAAYRTIDATRWARFYGVPYVEPAWAEHPWRGYALAAVAAGRLGNGAAYSHALFAAIFADGSGPLDDAGLAGLARFAGLPGDRLLADLADPQTEADHRHNIEAALAAGVFGVPSFVVDGEMFWGNDRLVLLRHHLLTPPQNS